MYCFLLFDCSFIVQMFSPFSYLCCVFIVFYCFASASVSFSVSYVGSYCVLIVSCVAYLFNCILLFRRLLFYSFVYCSCLLMLRMFYVSFSCSHCFLLAFMFSMFFIDSHFEVIFYCFLCRIVVFVCVVVFFYCFLFVFYVNVI